MDKLENISKLPCHTFDSLKKIYKNGKTDENQNITEHQKIFVL